VIAFEFDQGLGFIDWLPDPEEPEKMLASVPGSSRITAIMAGPVGTNVVDGFEVLPEWLPLDFADLLGLATGAPVSIPWWEFRATDGRLLRRLHIHSEPKPFTKAQPAIPDHWIGRLLTRARRSQHFGAPELRVVIRLLLRGRLNVSSIDDEIRSLLIALEALCIFLLPRDSSLHAGGVLQGADLDAFHSVFADATDRLHDLTRKVSSGEAKSKSAGFLQGLIKQLTKLEYGQQSPGFARQLEMLLDESELPDAGILDSYFGAHPELGERKWSKVLAAYRGRVMHRGYLGIGDEGFDARRAVVVSRHLQDILLRIVLKKLGYDGEYQPALHSMKAHFPLDWVTVSRAASELGFR
jgi:hypothetical protein